MGSRASSPKCEIRLHEELKKNFKNPSSLPDCLIAKYKKPSRALVLYKPPVNIIASHLLTPKTDGECTLEKTKRTRYNSAPQLETKPLSTPIRSITETEITEENEME